MMINVDLLDRLKNGENANEILDSFRDQLMNAEIEYNRQKVADKACETFAVTLTEATIAFLQTLAPDLTISPEERKALIEDGRKTAHEILAGVKMANLLADLIKPIAPEKVAGKGDKDPIADFLRDMGL